MRNLDLNLLKIAKDNRDLILRENDPDLGTPIRQAEDYLYSILGHNEIQVRKEMKAFKEHIYGMKGRATSQRRSNDRRPIFFWMQGADGKQEMACADEVEA